MRSTDWSRAFVDSSLGQIAVEPLSRPFRQGCPTATGIDVGPPQHVGFDGRQEPSGFLLGREGAVALTLHPPGSVRLAV